MIGGGFLTGIGSSSSEEEVEEENSFISATERWLKNAFVLRGESGEAEGVAFDTLRFRLGVKVVKGVESSESIDAAGESSGGKSVVAEAVKEKRRSDKILSYFARSCLMSEIAAMICSLLRSSGTWRVEDILGVGEA